MSYGVLTHTAGIVAMVSLAASASVYGAIAVVKQCMSLGYSVGR